MLNLKTYQILLNKICEIENLSETETKKANKMLNEKIAEILKLRNFIEENIKEYTDISYFFIIYAILLKSKEESNSFEDFKNGKIYHKIKNIIENEIIKFDLYHFRNIDEYEEKYQNDYDLLLNTSKIKNSYKDIAVEKFWCILDEI